eukprot:531283_1
MEISSMKTLSSSSSSYPSGGDGHISEDSSGSLVIHGNNKMGSLPNQHKMANKPPTSQTPNNNNYFDDEMDIHDMEQATHIATQISTAQSTESPSTQKPRHFLQFITKPKKNGHMISLCTTDEG